MSEAVVVFQSVAVEGYETGEHAPGLKLRGSGAYRAAHHIIKVQIQNQSKASREAEPKWLTVVL